VLLGADFNERDSLCWDQRLAANRTILRVDPKLVEHRNSLRPQMEVAADCVTALRFWLDARDQGLRALRASAPTRAEWCARWAALPGIPPLLDPVGLAPDTVSLDQLMAALQQHLPEDAVLVVDAGIHRVFAGQYWQARRPNSFFSACALAPMGWAISAAVGIQIARPQPPVVVLTGDGCMHTLGGELATLARYQLPVLVVVCDNEGYGSVYRRHQAGGPAAEHSRLPKVDWPQFAMSLGTGGACVSTLEQLHRFFEADAAGLRSRKRPCLLAVKTPLVQALPEGTANPSALVPTQKPAIRPSAYPQ
jgi:acetolactate synthase-1/2/3 large subunit